MEISYTALKYLCISRLHLWNIILNIYSIYLYTSHFSMGWLIFFIWFFLPIVIYDLHRLLQSTLMLLCSCSGFIESNYSSGSFCCLLNTGFYCSQHVKGKVLINMFILYFTVDKINVVSRSSCSISEMLWFTVKYLAFSLKSPPIVWKIPFVEPIVCSMCGPVCLCTEGCGVYWNKGTLSHI